MISSVDTSTGSARRLYRTCWSEAKIKRRPYPVSAAQLSSRHPGNEVAVSTTYWHVPFQGEIWRNMAKSQRLKTAPCFEYFQPESTKKTRPFRLGLRGVNPGPRLLPAVQGRGEADSVASQGGLRNPGRCCWWTSAGFPWSIKWGPNMIYIMGIYGNINEYILYVSRNPLPSGSGELGIERKTFTNMPQNIDESPQINKGRRTWVCLARGWT